MSPERAPFSTLSFPVGSLGIIAMDSCKELGEHVDRWLISERQKEMRGAEAPVFFFDQIEMPAVQQRRIKGDYRRIGTRKRLIYFGGCRKLQL